MNDRERIERLERALSALLTELARRQDTSADIRLLADDDADVRALLEGSGA